MSSTNESASHLQKNWIAFDAEFVPDAPKHDELGVFSIQAVADGTTIFAQSADSWWRDLKSWCDVRLSEGQTDVFMFGWQVIVDLGAFETWSVGRITWGKRFAPEGTMKEKKAAKARDEKTYYRPLGVQDQWHFPLFGLTFHMFDLKPLGVTMSMPHLEAVGAFLTKLLKLEHPNNPDEHSLCFHKLSKCPHGDPSHVVKVATGKMAGKEFPWKCPVYALRDAEVTMAFAKYLFSQGLNPERIGTPGQLASWTFTIPIRNKWDPVLKSGSVTVFEKNLRRYGTFAGRNECYRNGGPYKAAYVDRTSLYPESMLRCRAPMIRDTELCSIDDIDLKPGWTSDAYGWGLFPSLTCDDSVWSFPKRQENVAYVTGTFNSEGGILRATDDLLAGHTKINEEPLWVARPMFAPPGSVEETVQNKLEELFDQRVKETLPAEKKGMLKGAMNALSGKYGASEPKSGGTTNYLTYSALLARSHLLMAEWVRSEIALHDAKIYGFDTDAGVLSSPSEGSGVKDGIPFKFGLQEKVSADGKKHKMVGNMIYYRAKQYVMECDDASSIVSAQHGWRYEWDKFEKLGHRMMPGHLENENEEKDGLVVWQETKRTVDSNVKIVRALRLGGWIEKEKKLSELDLAKLLWADRKRDRGDYFKEPWRYNSYLLAKEGKWIDSVPWVFKAWSSYGYYMMKSKREPMWKKEIEVANETFSDTSQLAPLPIGYKDSQLDKLVKTILKERARRGLDKLSKKMIKA